jgi:hypothetical protein
MDFCLSEIFVQEQTLPPTRHDIEAKIVKRCWEDEAFRREFSADPTGTFSKYLQIPTSALPKIVVHEELPGSWHIVLPTRLASTDQLSEKDLEKVAGGLVTTPFIAASAASVAASAVSGATVSGAVTASVVVSVDQIVGW